MTKSQSVMEAVDYFLAWRFTLVKYENGIGWLVGVFMYPGVSDEWSVWGRGGSSGGVSEPLTKWFYVVGLSSN